jgi:hypothetical protein
MRFREKLLILFLAVVLSFLGFYLISSPFAEFLAMADKTANATAVSFQAKYEGDKSMQITCFDSYLGDSSFLHAARSRE